MANFKNTFYDIISGKQSVPESANGTGTISTNGKTVSGTDTLFLTEMPTGSWLVDLDQDEVRYVTQTYSDTIAYISNPFTSGLSDVVPSIIKSIDADVVTISVQIPSGEDDGELDGKVFTNGTSVTFSKDSRDRSSGKDLINPIIVDASGTVMQILITR